MKFIAIAAIAAVNAADVATWGVCTSADKCTTSGECCGDLKKLATAPTGANEANWPNDAKVCYTKNSGTDAASVSKKWDTAPSTKPGGFGSSDTVETSKTYKATFKCLATGAKTLAASAVLAATYYMA